MHATNLSDLGRITKHSDDEIKVLQGETIRIDNAKLEKIFFSAQKNNFR